MTLVIKPPPALLAEPRTTYWIGDPAIDREASEVARWAKDGDIGALVIKPGAKPTEIRWRPLTALELQAMAENPGEAQTRPRRAFRMGLVSVEGYDLHRVSSGDVRMISDRCLADLSELTSPLPWLIATNAWLEAEPHGRLIPVPKGPDGEELHPIEDTPLPIWLGEVILADTFRERRGR